MEYEKVTVPLEMPVTIPDEDPISATPVVPELQLPPGVPSYKIVISSAHMELIPDIIAGLGLTVTTEVVKQPVLTVKVIVAVPVETPVTTPEAEPTVATEVVPDIHVL